MMSTAPYWDGVVNNPLIPKGRPNLLYTLPPPHLFLNLKTDTKLNTFLYIWVTVRRYWLSRLQKIGCTSYEMSLSTSDWRRILSGIYFKSWYLPEGRGFDPAVDPPFDPLRFWEQGGPRVFGYDFDIGQDLALLLEDGSRLEPSSFLNSDLRAAVMWDLSLWHCQSQLDRADGLLVGSQVHDPCEHANLFVLRQSLFRPLNMQIVLEAGSWENPCPMKRRNWFSRFQKILCRWPRFDDMTRSLRSEMVLFASTVPDAIRGVPLDVDCLTPTQYEEFERALMVVYYRGVLDALGVIPTVPFAFPSLHSDLSNFLHI